MEKFENKKIIFELLKLKNVLNQAGKKKILFESDLTVANYEILKIIQNEDVETISEIQKFLIESLPSLTQKTKKLWELDYLKKEKDKDDPRKNNLKITERGKRVLNRVEKKIELVSSMIFLKYSQKEKEKFLEILEYLEKKLNKKIN